MENIKIKINIYNNIHVIKNKIDDNSSEQNKFYSKIKEDFEEMKRINIDIKKLINDVSERINKIKKKINENNQNRPINDYKNF
jgi:trans-2-enoyl-CoA reductase